MLPTDPPKSSDFSGLTALDMNNFPSPDGFKWCSEWTLACYLPDATCDKLLLAVETGFQDDVDQNLELRRSMLCPQSPMSDDAKPAEESKSKHEIGFLYANTWCAKTFTNQPSGCVIRRRLWVRQRELLFPEGVDLEESTSAIVRAETSVYLDDDIEVDLDEPEQPLKDKRQTS